MTRATNTDAPSNEPLLRHSKRKEWGLAILAWERDGRRAFQFEDGQLRVFAKEFSSLLHPVAVAEDIADETREALSRLLAINDQEAARAKSSAATGGAPVSIEDQIALFVDLYPGGFQDPQWKEQVRGAGVKRQTRKHRDAAIAYAQDKLSSQSLAAPIGKGDYATALGLFVDVLERTNLVSAAQLDVLKKLPPPRQQSVVIAVRNLLHDEGSYAARLGAFMDELVKSRVKPSWQVVTALGALVHPKDHVCVAPSVYREQAKWMAPNLGLSNVPAPAAYDRCVAMVRAIDEVLRGENLVARDLFDVGEFMRITLAPAGKRRALALREKRVAATSRGKVEAA
jgi:hypothetical protein